MKASDRFQGLVLTAADPGYDEERAGFNLEGPHRPSVVVAATCAEDVVEAVRHAAARDLPAAVQATGHGLGQALQGGVLISTGRMRGFEIDPASRTVRVEAGVRWKEVIAAAAEHGLAPPNGSSPSVGVAGYTLAGGLPLLGRTLGWAADRVRALEVVTWDGRHHRATATMDAELFRVLRGSGGTAGVVTAVELDLVPLTTVFGGALTFDGAQASTVLDAWLAWTHTAPREATSSIAMMTMPDLPAVPEAMRGRDLISVRIALIGSEEAGIALVRPLREAAAPLMDTLRGLPWTECATIASDPPGPHRYRGTGVMLGSLDGDGMREIVRGVGPGGPVPTVVQVNHLGGALAEPPAAPNVVGHREAAYLLRLLSVVGEGGTAPIEHAHEAVVAALGPRVLGRSLGFQFGAHPVRQWDACFTPSDLDAILPFRTERTSFAPR